MPRFKHAAIRAGFDIGPQAGLLVSPQGAFATNSLPLRRLIAFAYTLQDAEIAGPESLDTERYSIDAEPEHVPALPQEADQFRVMVQTLLSERFGLEFHWETQRVSALALCRETDQPGLRRAAETEPGPLLSMREASGISVRNAALEPLFTSWLSAQLGAPIVNRTDLSGPYSFDLKWEAGTAAEPPSRAALESALRSQLGLTLEAVETEIERLVVDRVERPQGIEPAAVEVEIDPAVFDRYVGRYSLPGGGVLTVSRDGAKFLSQLPGRAPVEIFAASETEFFPKTVPARLSFAVNDDGRAVAVVLRRGGREVRAQRVDEPAA